MIRPLLFAALVAAPLPALAQEASTVLAKVGDVEITVGQVIALRSRLPEQYQTLEDDQLYQGILEQMIQQQVLAAAIESDLTRADTLNLQVERRAVLASRMVERLARRQPSEDAVRAAYEEEYGGFEAEVEWNASHILLPTEDEARAVVAMVNDGEDFATLARTRSTGPSGPNGGALGWFGEGQMVPEFEAAVKELEVEGVSPPVQTQFGWHVVRLNERRLTEAPPLDEVRAQIEARLANAAVEAAIDDLVDDATIERMEVDFDASVIRRDDLIR